MTSETRERVAEGEFCAVDLCGCGALHVTLGPITVRLERQVVESIWVTIGEALHRLAKHGSHAATAASEDACRREAHAKRLS